MSRFVIVDAAAYDDTPRALHYYTRDLPRRSLFERQPEAKLADKGPWLVQLPDHPHTQVDGWLRALELEKPVVAWLTSNADFEHLFDHLERCLDLRRPNGKLALLRYWDGRVFLRLQRAFTPDQRRQLMGPIDQWRFRILGQPYTLDRANLEGKEAA
ncbi:DUF4123 domain-containing protein [Luteimonas sp. RD2P54]|uniref:DUF4123 domain-containing protein n=1 Tax=Luteimonas endophytica TaxID=3042023 RepID=A0ABT6J506_9GAMM|nr:DUF4123 domain-containing protein [Luteimonas endophytica]MDH5821907.1 DUF4123 domain-containing protein [Luteimonas endophytica]